MGKIISICSDFIDLLFVGWEGMPRNFFNQDGSKDRKINREAHLNNIIYRYINSLRQEISHDSFDSYCQV